jgi:CheY-like chemotaxis protein
MMGVEATRVIRQVLQYKGLIFGVTGNALEEDIKLFQGNGADEVIIKPLTKDKFIDSIEGDFKKKILISANTNPS